MANTTRSPPPPPAPSPRIFAPALSPRPKSTEPSSPSTTPTSTRRRPLQPHGGKRTSVAVARPWNRRLSFDTASGSSSPALSSSGSATPQSNARGYGALDAGGFTFRPSAADSDEALPPPATPESRADSVFDLGRMAMDIDEAVATLAPASTGGSVRGADGKVTRRKLRRRSPKTTINDLPDELLLRIFSFLNNRQGFRALPGRDIDTPEWYAPPVEIALVCQRWLPLARSLYLRSVKISHLGRISALHSAFTANSDLPLCVRHLSIALPVGAADRLHLCASPPADAHAPEAADQSEADNSPAKKRKPLTRADELRAVFQSCSHLLSLEVSGVAPALLLASSSRATSALHHLHQLRLSTVTRLTLRGGTGDAQRGGDGVPLLDAPSVRDALLALTGLRALTLRGYASSLSPDDALDFAPTRTHLGLTAKPLPLRARTGALLPLERLVLVECCVSPTDLRALLQQCQRGRLRSLAVEDQWDALAAKRNRRDKRWDKPTAEALHDVADLVGASVEHLRATLFNYPPATGVAAAAAGTALRSPERASPRLLAPASLPPPGSGGRTASSPRPLPPAGERHILDAFVSQLETLETLDVGGSVVTPALFLPAPPPLAAHDHHSTAPSCAPTHISTAPRLPPSVRTLTLRSCDLLPPSALLPFLRSLPPPRNPFSSPSPSPAAAPVPPPPSLRTLRTLGGTEHGWAHPTACLDVQRACWAAGVRWATGSGAGSRGGERGGLEAEEADGGWSGVARSGGTAAVGGGWLEFDAAVREGMRARGGW